MWSKIKVCLHPQVMKLTAKNSSEKIPTIRQILSYQNKPIDPDTKIAELPNSRETRVIQVGSESEQQQQK